MTPRAYYVVLALVAVLRVVELGLSRRNLARTRGADGSPAPAADPPWAWAAMVLLHAAWIVLPGVEVHLRGVLAPLWVQVLALALLVGTTLLRHACIRTLGRAWNARARVAPDLVVVAHGPYRLCRHPNYLAVLLELVALPAAGGAWISLVVLNAVHVPLLVRRIRGEERLLRRVPGYVEALGERPLLLPWPRRRRTEGARGPLASPRDGP